MGKIIGILFGLMLLGPRMGLIGVLFGLYLGYWFDKALKANLYTRTHQNPKNEQKKHQYSYQSEEKVASGFSPNKKLQKAFHTLKISEHSPQNDVKKAYRKLMSQYHPDKFAAKNLPPDMLKMAEERAQEITQAYECICKEKGWS